MSLGKFFDRLADWQFGKAGVLLNRMKARQRAVDTRRRPTVPLVSTNRREV